MALGHSPKIVTNNLVACWDAGNTKSNRGKRSLINWDSWNTTGVGVLSGAGPTGFGGLNQTVAGENSLVSGTDPWGNTNILWQTNPSGDSNNDGGWVAAYNSTIDNTRLYRSSVWIRRISATTSGNYYHGLHTNGTNDVILLDNTTSTNYYWDAKGIGTYAQNQWILSVGHVYPWNYSGTGYHPDSGEYYPSSTTKVGSLTAGQDCKFPSNATTMYQRVYHFYSTDTTSQIQFFQPRLDLVDGTQPTINELVNNVGSTWYDIVGGNNGTMINGPGYSSGYMTFDGVDDHILCPYQSYMTKSGNYTFSAWIRTSASGVIFQNCNNDATDRNGMVSNSGTGVTFGYFNGTAWVQVYAPINIGQWNHVVGVNSGGTLTLYTNGVASTTVSGSMYVHIATGLYLGRQTLDETNKFNGNIANITTYSRALSAAEVTQNFNALRGRFGI